MIYRIRNWDNHYENNRTRGLKHLEWVPVPNRMDSLGYIELVDHPNGAAHLGAWLAIIEIASRRATRELRGTLPQEGAEIPQALARISRLPAGLFAEVLPRLVGIGWVECIQPDTEIPQEGAEIPHLPAEIRHENAALGREWKGMEWKGITSSAPPMPQLPQLQSQSEYPLTIAEIRKHDPAVDEQFVKNLVRKTCQQCISHKDFPQASLSKVTDRLVAKACAESYATGPPGHRTGLLLSRVPPIVITWGVTD